MSGYQSRKNTRTQRKTQERSTKEEFSSESELESDATEKMGHAKTLKTGLPNFSMDILNFKQ